VNYTKDNTVKVKDNDSIKKEDENSIE